MMRTAHHPEIIDLSDQHHLVALPPAVLDMVGTSRLVVDRTIPKCSIYVCEVLTIVQEDGSSGQTCSWVHKGDL